jgi:hypothetical protein
MEEVEFAGSLSLSGVIEAATVFPPTHVDPAARH